MAYPIARALPGPAPHSRPMAELNTTPLIDVMLVLLVMFIITIPVATHTLPVDLPLPNDEAMLSPVENKIVVSETGQVLWNGEPVSQTTLRSLLTRSATMAPEATTLFEPEANASYADTAGVVRTVKETKVTKFAFVGNDRYRNFAAD